jgi:transcriptional repressor NrdR
MDCPYCEGDSKVVDSRPDASGIRRRRECKECGRRFTTHERVASAGIDVTKRGGRSEPFDAEKIARVLRRLSHDRRRLTEGDFARFARRVEAAILDSGATSVTSAQIADLVLTRLPDLDPVIHRRFSADYRDEAGEIALDLPAEPDASAAEPRGQLDLLAFDDL